MIARGVASFSMRLLMIFHLFNTPLFLGEATLQRINISHLGKRKIIFKMPFCGDMLVPGRLSSWISSSQRNQDFPLVEGKHSWIWRCLKQTLVISFESIQFSDRNREKVDVSEMQQKKTPRSPIKTLKNSCDKLPTYQPMLPLMGNFQRPRLNVQ